MKLLSLRRHGVRFPVYQQVSFDTHPVSAITEEVRGFVFAFSSKPVSG